MTADSWKICGEQPDHYSLLMHGFLKGHLYMDANVPEMLKACPDPWNPEVRGPNCPILQDASYYDGRFYLYYGVAPVVTLLLPFRLMTGADLPLPLATFCFASVGLLASLVLWQSIKERYFPDVRVWVGGAGVVILGVASLLPALLRRTLVYELPIAAAYCFSMAALLCLYMAFHAARHRVAYVVFASLCLGLAVASRLTFLFTLPVLLFPAWYLWKEGSRRGAEGTPLRLLIAAVMPAASIGVLMSVYNYLRFGSFTEFGTGYQVAELFYLAKMRNFALVHVPFNLVDYSLATPDLSRHYPYFLFPGRWFWPIEAQPDFFGPELVPGMLVCFPVCWFALFAFLIRRNEAQTGLKGWLFCLWGVFLGTWGCLLVFHAGIVRYMIDFTPSLMMGAAIGLLAFERRLTACRSSAMAACGRMGWLGLLAVSTAVAIMFSLELQGTFRNLNPQGHARVARFFEGLSFWNPRIPSVPAGPVELSIRSARIEAGLTEPLLSCGAGGSAEHIFLHWPDDSHVVVGYRRGLLTSGKALSAPISIKEGESHRLYLDLGSFYGGTSASAEVGKRGDLSLLDRLRRRWEIHLDGETILKGQYNEAVPAPGDLVFLGCNPNSDEFGKTLHTSIVSAKRLSFAEAAAKAADRSSLSMDFMAPGNRQEGSEILLNAAAAEGNLRVSIDYLDANNRRLRFEVDSSERARTGSFASAGRWHRLELLQLFDREGSKVRIRFDGETVAEFSGDKIDFRRAELRPGWDGSESSRFTGFIRNPASDSSSRMKAPPLPRRMTLSLRFPRNRCGASEPILVTGRTGLADLYEVVYLDDKHVQFRIDQWGAGIVRISKPVEIDYDIPHEVVFSFAGKSLSEPADGAPRLGSLQMEFDGRPVWEDGHVHHPFIEREVYLGLNDIGGSTCRREFTGEMISFRASADSVP